MNKLRSRDDLTGAEVVYYRLLFAQGDKTCSQYHAGYFCTRAPNHPGVHVAHGSHANPLLVWATEPEDIFDLIEESLQ